MKLFRPVPHQFPISSPFGNRLVDDGNGGKKIQHHNGIDFACPVGTPVFAMIDGKIFRAGWQNENDPKEGFGLRIWQEFAVDSVQFYSWYGHLNRLRVSEGETVRKGQVIGDSGITGSSRGAHLHVQACRKNTRDFFNLEFYSNAPTIADADEGGKVA